MIITIFLFKLNLSVSRPGGRGKSEKAELAEWLLIPDILSRWCRMIRSKCNLVEWPTIPMATIYPYSHPCLHQTLFRHLSIKIRMRAHVGTDKYEFIRLKQILLRHYALLYLWNCYSQNRQMDIRM